MEVSKKAYVENFMRNIAEMFPQLPELKLIHYHEEIYELHIGITTPIINSLDAINQFLRGLETGLSLRK